MSLQQLVISYLAIGLIWGVIHTRFYSNTLLDFLKGKTVTIYGRDEAHAQKRADDLRESAKDIRKIQDMVSDKIMAFLFALVLTSYCIFVTITFFYHVHSAMNCKYKLQVKEKP